MDRFGIECKKLMFEETQKRLKETSTIFFTSFQSMEVSEQEQLRRKLEKIDSSLFVIKNRIAERAFKQSDQAELAKLLQGPSALALGGCDSITVSKTLVDFAGKHANFKILGAYINQEILNLDSIKTLAAIPSKEILLAQIVGGIKSPIQGLITSLSAVARKFVIVLDKIREAKPKA